MKQIVILFLVVVIATVSVIAEESGDSSVANVNDSVSGRKKHRFPNAICKIFLRNTLWDLLNSFKLTSLPPQGIMDYVHYLQFWQLKSRLY